MIARLIGENVIVFSASRSEKIDTASHRDVLRTRFGEIRLWNNDY
jgi:hypothetical protein